MIVAAPKLQQQPATTADLIDAYREAEFLTMLQDVRPEDRERFLDWMQAIIQHHMN
jgi:hypothetical protein